MNANRLLRSFPLAGVLAWSVTRAFASDLIDLRAIDALHGDAAAGRAKAAVCLGCHGPAGVSPVPLFPNLAGQHAEYLYWQLVTIKREARPESPMTPIVATLDDAAMRDLAAYFSSLPAATPVPSTARVDAGARVYRDGAPAAGVPPCQGCHGRDALGHPLADQDAHWRAYPVLRGQHAGYLMQRLKDFRDGRHTMSTNDRIMTPIARTLTDASIADLAAWLESPAP